MRIFNKAQLIICASLIAFLLLTISFKNASASNQKPTIDNSELEFILEIENNVVNYGEEVKVQIFIKNNTNHKIIICQIPASGINYIFRYDRDNKNTFKDEFSVADIKLEKKDFESISAKSKKLFSSSAFGKEYFFESGKWGIQITQKHNFTGENLGLKAWTGIIESNVVNVFIESNLIIEATVEESRIGKLDDRIDAYVPENDEQFYFVRFHVDKVLKGEYGQPTLGVRLHSPSLTFGLKKENNAGKRYEIFLNNEVSSDGRRILLVQPSSKPLK